MSKAVIITGGSGNLGEEVLRILPKEIQIISIGRMAPSNLRDTDIFLKWNFLNGEPPNKLNRIIETCSIIGIALLAGIDSHESAIKIKEETWQRIMRVNVFAHFILLRTILNLIDNNKNSNNVHIVAASSDVLDRPEKNSTAYAGSKAALESGLISLLKDFSLTKTRLYLIRIPYLGIQMREIAENNTDYLYMHKEKTPQLYLTAQLVVDLLLAKIISNSNIIKLMWI